MNETAINIISIVVILLIITAAIIYIIIAKKKGKKCIGCPYSSTCSKCSCDKEKTNS